MELTLDQQQQIAGLKGHPGYQLMIQLLLEKEQELLDDMATTGEPDKALRKMRWWQMTRRFIGMLRDHPENIAAEIELLKAEGNLTDQDLYMGDPWTKRFGPVNPIEQADPNATIFDGLPDEGTAQ